MAKKLIKEEVIEEVVTPIEETIEEVTPEVVQEVAEAVLLKDGREQLLVSSLAKVDATHLEKNAILPLINGLIK